MVYPHVCGATTFHAYDRKNLNGLSPRVWGNPLCVLFVRSGMWSIPTCVGQPCGERIPLADETVYPHVCGATVPDSRPAWQRRGLSPRVWGNQFAERTCGLYLGSIPTCVGQPVL